MKKMVSFRCMLYSYETKDSERFESFEIYGFEQTEESNIDSSNQVASPNQDSQMIDPQNEDMPQKNNWKEAFLPAVVVITAILDLFAKLLGIFILIPNFLEIFPVFLSLF